MDSTGIISYAEITGELRIPKYRKLKFSVTFVVNGEGTLAGSANDLNNRIRAIILMTQLIQDKQKKGIQFVESKCMDIPAVMITEAPRSELRKEDERILLNYGFIKFIEISEEDDIFILP